ncbi:alpha/beta fold hydrolase [Pseudomonas sp. FME51]|uniref:alpha/beta fold hydrolase n=1 Tax=Pseudomonas sp. FME51 TaxID=2742609 RepID=UPI001868024A|nr:alpha/beta hydrolase [Pseudomonas sp. FME51]
MTQSSFGDSRVDHSDFERQEYFIDGCNTVVYSAGQGQPLVFLHGGGTWHGIDFARTWLDRYRVILPYHPGFGESADNPSISSMEGYIQHYQKLFEQMGLTDFNLVGFSLGGRMAAEYAIQHGGTLRKLVLIAPAGLDVKEHPQPDFLRIPPEDFPGWMVNDIATLAPFLPSGPDEGFAAMRMREGGSVARISSNGEVTNPELPDWLPRIKLPTLLAWGENDRIVPPGQAGHWHRLIPHADVRIFPSAGHLLLDESLAAREAVADFID